MDTLVFIAAKIVALLLRAETWEALLIAGALLALVRERLRAARGLLISALASLLALGIFPIGDLLIAPLEQAYPTNPQPTHVDGIIIPGGAEDGAGTARHHQVQLNAAAERVTAGLALARDTRQRCGRRDDDCEQELFQARAVHRAAEGLTRNGLCADAAIGSARRPAYLHASHRRKNSGSTCATSHARDFPCRMTGFA